MKKTLEDRDISDYTNKYLVETFENIQVKYRRRKILEEIQKYKHRRILEIGCGMEPLFSYLNESEYDEYVVVEPSDVFYENALKQKNDKVTVIHGYFGSDSVDLGSWCFDFVICASLLHELPDDESIMRKIAQVCNGNTVVHINVPNAYSMHRTLAKIGGIEDEHEMSKRNIELQQFRVYDAASLKSLSETAGFQTLESGTFFVKPFTHQQMYELMKNGIIDDWVLDGLYALSKEVYYQDIGSEIFVNLKLKQ